VRRFVFFIHCLTEPTPNPSIPFVSLSPLSLTHAPLRTQPGYMHTLASELANEASPVFVRNAAGLALKNALTARVRRAIPTFLPPILLVPLHRSRSYLCPTGQHASG
jgi:hypothetical protein